MSAVISNKISLIEQRQRNLLIALFKNDECNVSLKVSTNKGDPKYNNYVLSLTGENPCMTYEDLRQAKQFGFEFGRIDLEDNKLTVTFIGEPKNDE